MDNATQCVVMESSNEPWKILEVAQSMDRMTIVQFHPLAENVIASVSTDYVIRVWNTQSATVMVQLDGHPDQVNSVNVESIGCCLATTFSYS